MFGSGFASALQKGLVKQRGGAPSSAPAQMIGGKEGLFMHLRTEQQ